MIFIISPHYDDAVFSLCEHIAHEKARVTIVTVMGNIPDGAGHDKVVRLRDEHLAVCEAIGADHIDLPFDDGAHGPSPTPSMIADELADLFAGFRAALTIFTPLGIHHPDHLLTAAGAMPVALECARRVGIYEELPYRVLYPESVVDALGDIDVPVDLDGCGGHLVLKRLAVRMYASQVNDDLERCVYAPERVWWT